MLVERYGEVVRSGLRYAPYELSPRDVDRAAGLPVAACRFAKLLPGLPGERVRCGIIGLRPGLLRPLSREWAE